MKEPQSKADAPQASGPAPAATNAAMGGAAAVGQARELSSGRPLGGAVRPRFEAALSADLGDVRVHTDSAGAQMAAKHGANAVAVGQDIYGPAANLDASTPGGRETLAHEVIHTVQSQQAGTAAPMASSDVSSRSTDAAEVEARSGAPAVAAGQSFQVRQAPSAPAMLDDATIEAAIDDATKSIADIMTVISREHPTYHEWFLDDPAKVTKLVNRFTGDQAYQALVTMRGDTAPNHAVFRLGVLRRAGGVSAGNVQSMVRAIDPAELPGVFADAPTVAFLKTKTVGGPLAVFRAEAAGLSAGAEASADFMNWLIADTTAVELLRVFAATGRASLVTTLSLLPTGWTWLANLPGGPGLTPDQVTALTALRDASAAGTPARTQLDAKLAEAPLAATPAEAQTQLTALLATAAPNELQILNLAGTLSAADQATLAGNLAPASAKLSAANLSQLLRILQLPLLLAVQALQAAAVTDPAACQDLMRSAPVADRLTVAADAAVVPWLLTVITDNTPLAIFGVQPGESAQFIAKQPFFAALMTRMSGPALLGVLGDTANMTAAAAQMDADPAGAVTFLNTLPSSAELGFETAANWNTQHGEVTSIELQLRGLRLAVTAAPVGAWFDTFFADVTAVGATQSSAAVPEQNYTSPRARLDAALTANDSAAAVDAVGALQGAELVAVRADDGGILTRMAGVLTADAWYLAMRALDVVPAIQVAELAAAGHGSEAHYQGILGNATDVELIDVARGDAAVRALESEIDGSPVPIFNMGMGVPDAALQEAEFRTWLLAETDAIQLLWLLNPGSAPILDANAAWGWLARLPDGAKQLTAVEQVGLEQLRNAATDAAAINRMTEILENDDHTAATPADALTDLQAEFAAAATDPTRCLALATQLVPAGRATIIGAERAHATATFDVAQMTRFAMVMQMPLATAIDWVQGVGAPNAQQLQTLIDVAGPADLAGVFAQPALATLCQNSLELSPALAMRDLPIAGASTQATFWTWTLAKVEPYEVLRLLTLAGANLDAALVIIKTQQTATYFDTLPKGMGLAPAARADLDSIFPRVTDSDWQKAFFMLRFDCTLSGGWADATGPTGGDLKALYAQLLRLPLEQVANNRFLSIFNRTGSGSGGSYAEGTGQIDAGADQATMGDFYDGEAHAYQEQYFAHTIRHEVGHAVDAAMGGRTALCFDMAGWFEYPEGSAEQFIDDQNGFIDDGGGPALTAPEKASVVSAARALMDSADSRIDGPKRSIMTMLPDDHILKTRPDIRFAQALNATSGQMHYTAPYDDGTHTWSINYYYQRWMKVKSTAANSAPRDYTLFAPAEYFADMYAEFYHSYDGTPATEPALGGHVPAAVKTWLMNNVHTIGYDPHNRRDAAGPAPLGVGHGGP